MTDPEKPCILILGAGAVGLALAGALSEVADLHVACRPVHADSIQRQGLIMEGVWGDRNISGISCCTEPQKPFPDVDCVFITAKGTGTRLICEQYAGAIAGRPVVSMQNGIGNEEIISEFTDQVIGGTVTTNFTVMGPGHVRVQNQSSPMKLGLFYGDADLSGLVSLLQDAGIAAEASPDIRSDIWVKSLLNLTANPLGAILSICVGDSGDEDLRDIIQGIVREAFAVTEREGISLPWATADEYLEYLCGVQIPDFAEVYTSMYYDIQKKRLTEIDLLNGYVARKGDEYGIPTPYNHCITGLVRFRSRMQR